LSYKDRQQALKLMQAGYAENQLPEKIDEIKRAQAMQAVQLNEVEQRHPHMMISAGYRILDELNKPAKAETETEIQFGSEQEKDTELEAVEEHLDNVNDMFAKMDAMLEYMKPKVSE
jgi:hypothetical protein